MDMAYFGIGFVVGILATIAYAFISGPPSP